MTNVCVFLLGTSVIVAGVIGALSSEGPMTDADEVRNWSARIEALVSKNQPPKLVEQCGKTVAEFPADFDWNEQKRMYRAVAALWGNTSETEWEELVLAAADNRYSVTVRVTEKPDAGNLTVGDLSGKLAVARLVEGFERHLRGGTSRWRILQSIGVSASNLSEWRSSADRKDSPLHLLQIEVSRMAVKFIQEQEHVQETDKIEMVNAIQAEIVKIEKTAKPCIQKMNATWLEAYRSPNE